MDQLLNFMTQNQEVIAFVVTLILAIVKIIRERMQAREALLLLLNVLKDEKKMQGHKIADAAIDKLEKVSEIQKVGKDVKDEVKRTLSQPRDGFKIGSYKGKPVYLRDVGRITGVFSAGASAIKGIFKW